MRTPRLMVAIAAATLAASALAACGGQPGIPRLSWYINPDDGGQAALAAKCTKAANGRYKISTSLLPNDATSQREQLVRRLAAHDSSIDLMSLDPVFVAEFANAGFLTTIPAADATQLTKGIFPAAVQAATWNGKLVAAPFWANTQLLWYRKSVAQRAGIDMTKPVTWQQLISAATKTRTTIAVQGRKYEGYMVWVNALVESAGGHILTDPQAGKNVTPGIDSPAGTAAATVVRDVARSAAAPPALSNMDEEAARNAFQGANGGFMVNWPYVWAAWQSAVKDGSLPQSFLDDVGWARYPAVTAEQPSRPPFGGIELGIGAYGSHQDFALEAARCITSPESQATYMIGQNPAAAPAVYDEPAVRKVFPMADLIRDSVQAAAPRPLTPYYTDVSAAVQRDFHPPASVNPASAPKETATLIVDVLHDRRLL